MGIIAALHMVALVPYTTFAIYPNFIPRFFTDQPMIGTLLHKFSVIFQHITQIWWYDRKSGSRTY